MKFLKKLLSFLFPISLYYHWHPQCFSPSDITVLYTYLKKQINKYLPPSSASDSVSADALELTPFLSWTFLLIPEKSCISKTVFICISLDFFSWIISDSTVSFDFSSYNSRTISRISCSCLSRVVYMSSSFLHLAVGSHDLSQTEKEITVCYR